MNGLCDIHAHVLPGIDDGPGDLERSLEMLRSAAESGIVTIAATPHLRADFPDVHVRELAERCDELVRRARSDGIALQIVAGAETSLAWALEAGDEELALASYGQRGTDLLIETPQVSTAALNVGLYDVQRRGFRVTLAHPERSHEFQEQPSRISALAHQGVLIQVNADTLLGDARKSPACRLGRRLCTAGLVHVLASDGHRAQSWRPITSLARAVNAAAGPIGPERARWMAETAPTAVLEGRDLPEAPPISLGPRRGGLGRWRRGSAEMQ